ncbi:uncharacterized protein LOC112349742 [Selaginella moellendorffii]|uniref:uncharacterized protein LOC112349742 n=1 Tax=Selaginella moellendorffii TaxID=88036 RepID=UPI000D1CB378|nr:uncharacterized protein LOC112349742 [Selaginella moellendorffii]|eukprot:XP_024540464.1 uncharacterized protein LOC112349742 [Selaginella moellendorffii]
MEFHDTTFLTYYSRTYIARDPQGRSRHRHSSQPSTRPRASCQRPGKRRPDAPSGWRRIIPEKEMGSLMPLAILRGESSTCCSFARGGRESSMQTCQFPRPRDCWSGKRIAVVSLEQQLEFARKGHVCVRGLFSSAGSTPKCARRKKCSRLTNTASWCCTGPGIDLRRVTALIQSKGNDELGFLQMFHLHRRASSLLPPSSLPARPQRSSWDQTESTDKLFVFLLLRTNVFACTRSLFIKLPGFSVTKWYSDLNIVPLDTHVLDSTPFTVKKGFKFSPVTA